MQDAQLLIMEDLDIMGDAPITLIISAASLWGSLPMETTDAINNCITQSDLLFYQFQSKKRDVILARYGAAAKPHDPTCCDIAAG